MAFSMTTFIQWEPVAVDLRMIQALERWEASN